MAVAMTTHKSKAVSMTQLLVHKATRSAAASSVQSRRGLPDASGRFPPSNL
jgi:hypothetical protein